ncbi:hypothetical protein [Nonomuraea sp. NEAU-A123]|uniref:hypothetical protein n=1 Tax=Nonomuraea sp. NEAU-A123 TaxID=2839649 RepID=UPI001BE3D2AE|nr:hypothetical protein [Nonomuraea sp. NEAU-A123]MBT2232150.1 hypothetical protein [Nonomuraea sp. NEAU-A123]
MNRKVGRPQGGPRGSTQQANALAEFLLTLTAGMTVRELAARYHVGKTLWSEYRSGLKIIPLELLTRLVQDHAPDERTRHGHMETATRLYAAALEAAHREPIPVAPPPLPPPTSTPTAAVMAPAESLERLRDAAVHAPCSSSVAAPRSRFSRCSPCCSDGVLQVGTPCSP